MVTLYTNINRKNESVNFWVYTADGMRGSGTFGVKFLKSLEEIIGIKIEVILIVVL